MRTFCITCYQATEICLYQVLFYSVEKSHLTGCVSINNDNDDDDDDNNNNFPNWAITYFISCTYILVN